MDYIINKGKHWAKFTWNRLWPFSKRVIRGTIMLSSNCAYCEVEQPGWNKITGITSLFIHYNSSRIVFQPGQSNKVRIAFYRYVNGVRIINELPRQFDVYKRYKFMIDQRNGMSIIVFDGISSVRKMPMSWPLFRCFPYFGGQCTSPYKLYIEVNIV